MVCSVSLEVGQGGGAGRGLVEEDAVKMVILRWHNGISQAGHAMESAMLSGGGGAGLEATWDRRL